MAFLVAIFYIFISLDAGLFNKFARNPVSFDILSMFLNFLMVATNLIGLEYARYYFLKNSKTTWSYFYVMSVTLLFTLLETSITGIFSLNDSYILTQYLGQTFLPSLADNLLSSYLSLIAGPIAALAYRAPVNLFEWFSPWLPDLPWGYESIIGVMIPTIGFSVIAMTTSILDYRKAGLIIHGSQREKPGENSPSKGFLIASFVTVLIIWSYTGLLGFQPRVVVSGSMSPIINVGDVAITVKADPEYLVADEIIQYRLGSASILHRIERTYRIDGLKYFITKGDANPIEDNPITGQQITGKLIYVIPKVGWASILFRQIIFDTFTTIVSGESAILVVTGVSAVALIFIAKSKRKSLRRLFNW